MIIADDDELKKYEKQFDAVIADIGYRYIRLLSVVDMSLKKFNNWVDIVSYY